MTAIKRTARRGIDRLRTWGVGLRSNRDMVRRYKLLARLANLETIRRGFPRHTVPRIAAV